MIKCQLCTAHHGVFHVKQDGKEIYVCPVCLYADPKLLKQIGK